MQSNVSEKIKKNFKNYCFWPKLQQKVFLKVFLNCTFKKSQGFLRCIQCIWTLLLSYQSPLSDNFSVFIRTVLEIAWLLKQLGSMPIAPTWTFHNSNHPTSFGEWSQSIWSLYFQKTGPFFFNGLFLLVFLLQCSVFKAVWCTLYAFYVMLGGGLFQTFSGLGVFICLMP